MKIIIILFILILIMIGIGFVIIQKKPKQIQEYPYIKDNILHFKENKSIPVNTIIGVEIVNNPIRHVIIHYEFNKYTGGMYIIELWQYKKLLKDLLL